VWSQPVIIGEQGCKAQSGLAGTLDVEIVSELVAELELVVEGVVPVVSCVCFGRARTKAEARTIATTATTATAATIASLEIPGAPRVKLTTPCSPWYMT